MVAILSLQRDAILTAVRTMYTEVANHPERGFHFPTGRAACEFVGYPAEVLDQVPAGALEAFAGVGYPFAIGVVERGDTVLDVGSGSGTDTLIAARIVGSEGRVYGLDMTGAMLEKLGRNAEAAGTPQVVPLEGEAEAIPLPDESVSVVTSNGVLNLVPDKERGISEIYRVLKPGGYAQIADIVLGTSTSDQCRLDPALWAECVVGAVLQDEYVEMFRRAGFECGTLGSMDYFAGSSSPETRSVAQSLGARSIVLWAAKPPLGRRERRSTTWPAARREEVGEAMSLPAAAAVLEAYGVTCGCLEPLLKERMRELESGEVLEVRSDEPAARVGVPSWSRLTGNALVATVEGEGTTTRFFLRRK